MKNRLETTQTPVKVWSVDKLTGAKVTKESYDNAGCCSFMSRSSHITNENKFIRSEVRINRLAVPERNDSNEFIQEWIDFVNTLGFKLVINFPKKKDTFIPVVLESEHRIRNYYHLFALNAVRYLWSTHYDHLPRAILKLRANKTLEHLDNWEIFQLGHHTPSKVHFHDMSPVQPFRDEHTYYITSKGFLDNRINEHLGGHLTTFNIRMANTVKSKLIPLRKAKDYLGMYNLLSTKVNKVLEVSKAKCLDASGFENELNVGTSYEILRTLKKTIKITNKNYIKKLYSIDRFKLI